MKLKGKIISFSIIIIMTLSISISIISIYTFKANVVVEINNINEMIDTVAAVVEEQSNTAKEIAIEIADVNNEANIMSGNGAEVSTSASGLNKLSEGLKKAVDQFKI